MGLDMYVEVLKKNTDIQDIYEREVVTDVVYFRKANQIQGYFSRLSTYQDNGYTLLTVKDLRELVETCKTVLADPEVNGPNLLPTRSGFFFGSLEYDEYYIRDLERCVSEVEAFLKDYIPKEDEEIYYVESY